MRLFLSHTSFSLQGQEEKMAEGFKDGDFF